MKVKQGSTWTPTWGVAYNKDNYYELSKDDNDGISSLDVYASSDNYFTGIKIGNECLGDCSKTKVGSASPGGKLYYVSAAFSEGTLGTLTFTRVFAISFGFVC